MEMLLYRVPFYASHAKVTNFLKWNVFFWPNPIGLVRLTRHFSYVIYL